MNSVSDGPAPPSIPPPDRLRVMHVASGREWRGGQRQVFLLARALSARPDLETLVVTGRRTRLAERLAAAAVPLSTPGWGIGLDPRVTLAVLAGLRPGTIVHAHDNHAFALAALAQRIHGFRLVVTRRLATPIRRPARFNAASAVIAISGAVRDEAVASGVVPGKIHVVPDAIDLDAVTTWRPWPDTVAAPDPQHPLVVCVAALTAEKGVRILLGAAGMLRERLPAVRWLVVGEGREREALEAERARLGLDEVVHFTGQISAPEAVLARATVAVQPSLNEGFGSSVLDALALGVPVIATRVGGLPDAVAGGGAVLIPPGDPHALAAEVARLVADPDQRAALALQARNGVRRFAIDRLVDETLDVYRSLMKTPGSR